MRLKRSTQNCHYFHKMCPCLGFDVIWVLNSITAIGPRTAGPSPRAQLHLCEVQVHQHLPSGSLPGTYSLRKVYRHSCSQPTGAMRPALPHTRCPQEKWCVDPMGVSPRWAWRADEEGRGSRQLSFHPKEWALPPHTSS